MTRNTMWLSALWNELRENGIKARLKPSHEREVDLLVVVDERNELELSMLIRVAPGGGRYTMYNRSYGLICDSTLYRGRDTLVGEQQLWLPAVIEAVKSGEIINAMQSGDLSVMRHSGED
jgi:hypothetical protein